MLLPEIEGSKIERSFKVISVEFSEPGLERNHAQAYTISERPPPDSAGSQRGNRVEFESKPNSKMVRT